MGVNGVQWGKPRLEGFPVRQSRIDPRGIALTLMALQLVIGDLVCFDAPICWQ